MPDESSDKPETPETSPTHAAEDDAHEGAPVTEDALNPEAIARRVAAFGDEDEVDRIAREEEVKLAERRAKTKGGKRKAGLEAAASKRLQKIGGKVPPKRVAFAADADPLLMGTGRFGKWFRQNQRVVSSVGLVVLVALVGLGGYSWWTQRTEAAASTALTEAVNAERGRIGDPAKEDDDEGAPKDPRPIFKTDAERRDAALAKYKEVETRYKGTGAAYLARLQEGSLLLDKGDFDGATAAFTDATKSPLAAADSEVKGRALEGLGLAAEAKAGATPAEKDKWLDQAAQQYRALENTDVKGFKELGMYHQARVAEVKGEKDKAIQLLKSLHERLNQPGENHPFPYLEPVVDDRLRTLDPSALPPKPKGQMPSAPGGNPKMNDDQIQKIIEQLKRQAEQQGGGAGGGGGGVPTPMPMPNPTPPAPQGSHK